VFYIGGTKVGALFGEAVVISNPAINEDFRYFIKQHGGMLAKGRLLGVQFEALLADGLYFEVSRHANALADQIRATLEELHIPLLVPGTTNQIFAILPDTMMAQLREDFAFNLEKRMDASHCAVRFCTSWATDPANVEKLCCRLRELA
jgi:threonine aldolase